MHEVPAPARDWRSATSGFFLRLTVSWVLLLAIFEQHGGPLRALPVIGTPVHDYLQRPLDLLGQAVGIHLFHLSGRAADLHVQATGDSAIAWVTALVIVVLAAIAAVAWSSFSRLRAPDESLLRWLRLITSLLLGVALVEYGFIKVFPLQFPSPPLALLNEPVGNSSPTLLFWSIYGLNPAFEMTLGWIEVATGLLLLFRKTAFAGALIALGVTANVALLDLAFDVPVKLFSLTLVLLSLVLLAPELPRISAFLLHRPNVGTRGAWAPEPKTKRWRNIALAAEILFAMLACWQSGAGTWSVYRLKLEALRDPAPFTGKWVIQGHANILSGNNTPITTIFFDPNTDMMLQDANGDMWRSRAIYNRANHMLRVLYEAGGMSLYRVDQPANDLLRLVPVGPASPQNSPITLTRMPLPKDYPLLHRQFHWVNEFEPLR
jgi:hypothetical protein